MVDTDDTRRTTDDGRRTTDDGRRTTPRVWHKLPTGELKKVPEKHIINFFGLSDILNFSESFAFCLVTTKKGPLIF